ncbi:UNVERIFIED_ORG: hypothetical protein B5F06_06355 [Lacrimispora saccharolytica]
MRKLKAERKRLKETIEKKRLKRKQEDVLWLSPAQNVLLFLTFSISAFACRLPTRLSDRQRNIFSAAFQRALLP